MPLLRHALVIAMLVSTIACSRDESSPSLATDTVGTRTRAFPIRAETLWTRGGTESDSIFADPWFLAAGSGGVFVTDADRGLIALTDSGTLRYGAGAPTYRELLGPITVLADSTLVLARRSDGALHFFDPAGKRYPQVPASEAPQALGLCALDDQHFLLAGGPRSLTIVDRRGGTPLPFPIPWTHLRDSSTLLQQTVIASSAGRTGCVIALVVGNEFALLNGEDSTTFHPFIESIEIPAVRHTIETAGDQITTTDAFVTRAITAESVAMDDTLVFVAFAGAGARREGLVDLYDRGTGRYRSSLRLGVPIQALATGNGALYVLHSSEGIPTLMALRLVHADSSGISAARP